MFALLQFTFFFLNGNTRPVTNILVGTGQSIEQGCLTTVRVARECDFNCHFFPSMSIALVPVLFF